MSYESCTSSTHNSQFITHQSLLIFSSDSSGKSNGRLWHFYQSRPFREVHACNDSVACVYQFHCMWWPQKVVNASRIVVTTSKKVVSTGWKKFIFGVAMACSIWIFVRSVAWKLYKITSLDFATATPKINFFHLHDWILYTTDFSFVNWLHRLHWFFVSRRLRRIRRGRQARA